MSPIDTILEYAYDYELSVQRGKCPVEKLFMFERCNYSDILQVRLPGVDDAFIDEQLVVHVLKVEVYVLGACPSYKSNTWNWEPKEYYRGMVMFYHHDFDELLRLTAEWLEQHKDPIAPDYNYNKMGIDIQIHPLKCDPIGRIKHYTTQPGFEEGNLERKRDW